MREHLEQYGRIFKIERPDGETRYVHEKPFAERTWDEPSVYASHAMSSVLRRCREKEIEVPQGQLFLAEWYHVSSEAEIVHIDPSLIGNQG
jgi:hypothetical protein